MNPEGALLALLRAPGCGVAGTWSACAALLGRLDPAALVAAVTPPGSWLDDRLRAALDPARLLRVQPAPAEPGLQTALSTRDAATTAPELLAGEHDRDLPAPPRLGWPGRAPAPPRRLRRLDTLCDDATPVGLLVIEAGAAAPGLLRGAARLLRSHAPMLLVSLEAVPPAQRPALWEDCVAATDAVYGWHDGFLLPREDAASRRDAVLILAETAACALPPLLLPALAPPEGLDPNLAAADARLAAIAWSAGTTPLGRLDRPQGSACSFDAALPCAGFHPAETDGGGTWWRWSGPDPHAAFALPLPGGGRWRLLLRVLNWGVAGTPATLGVSAGGVPLAPERLADGVLAFRPFTIAPPAASGLLRVDLVTPPPHRASADDARRIGINLTAAALEPAPPGAD